MSKDTCDTEKTWKDGMAVRRRVVTSVDGDKATVEEMSRMEQYASGLSGGMLRALCIICENPGKKKTEYSEGSKTMFNNITELMKLGLVAEEREAYERYPGLYPTDMGTSLYTGMWYAAHTGKLVDELEAHGILIPFVFWKRGNYRLRVLDDTDEDSIMYELTERLGGDGEMKMTIWDVYMDAHGTVSFLPGHQGMSGGQRMNTDWEMDYDLDDKGTRECLKLIAKASLKLDREVREAGYQEILEDLDEE